MISLKLQQKCNLLSEFEFVCRGIMTSSTRFKSNPEWLAMQREKKVKAEKHLKRIQTANPFKTNIGLRHQVCKNKFQLLIVNF
jgi:arginyl-tRNA synthetase